MSTEKPKYIRKKCKHNKYSFQCKECKGSSICPHGKIKSTCKDCKGCNVCPHDRIRNNCVDCNGISICEHKKRRIRCKECKGSSICSHQKLKSRCKECNGSERCIHQKRKEYCQECSGSSWCLHNKRKSRCLDCMGNEICSHSNNKYNCIECHGKGVCEHNKLRYQCIDCSGHRVCIHDKRRETCITCTPSSACQHCKHVSILGSRWNPYCFRCFCILHPDIEIPRKFKLKEHHVRDKLKEHFQESLTMRFDKIVEGGCSRKRPDVFIDFGSHVLIIEVDENRHSNYSCEEKRMVELYEDIGFRKIIFLRFNPDGYTEGKKKYASPFRYTPTGILSLNQSEFDRRMTALVARIHAHRTQEPSEQLTVEYLFYG